MVTLKLMCGGILASSCFLFVFLGANIEPVSSYNLQSAKQPCAILYSEDNFTGVPFPLSDEDQTVDLIDDYRLSGFGWNNTGSIQLESGCTLEICNEKYFDGQCETLKAGSEEQIWADFQSAKCSCVRECKCEDIFMKRSTCGRAYLKGGCRTCNSMYTDILQGEMDMFPFEYETKVEAFRLRKGCSLRIFDDEKFNGVEETITGEFVEDFSGVIGSYICECNDDEYESKPVPDRPEDYPPMIDIPRTIDDVIRQLTTVHKEHAGLISAHKSLKIKRSSTNAYILLLGSTGAGKSSAINILFDNPNITLVGGEKSTTSDIHEFRIPVPVDELGVQNSELRVIDTPGLGDTRGIGQDATFLATLDEYLATHEDLKDRIPNVVLIFHKFTDNRFDGIGANFVKMLRGLDSFRERITDENFSNVIFVLSHFASSPKEVKRRPESRLKRFKEVIESYAMFPKPILISLAENKGRQEELPMVNGYYKMPNNEYYPRNLFEKLELVTQSAGDMMGLAVFRTAFRDSEDFNVTSYTTKLVASTHSKVGTYLQKLSDDIFNIDNSQVSQMLKDAFEEMPEQVKTQYPHSLQYIQKAFNLRNIFLKQEIPKTTTQILELLSSIKKNEATTFLMEKGLDLKAPSFKQNAIAGYSYNVFKDVPLANSPLNMHALQHSDIGYKVPRVLTCNLEQKTTENFFVLKTKEEYIRERQQNLGIEASSIAVESFTGEIKPGYNIREISFKNDSTFLTATREIRLFEFVLNDKLDLTKEFVAVVKSLPPFNSSDYDNVQKWTTFFNEYGTHVVSSVHGGGSIEIHLTSDKPFNSEIGQALMDLIKFAEDMSFMMTNIDGTSNRTVLQPGITHTLTFAGGDPQYHTSDLTKLSIEAAGNLLDNWKKSLKYNPVMLKTEMKLLPMSQVVRKLGQNYSKEIERATQLLFNSSLKFDHKAATATQPLARDETPLMLEMIKMTQESQRQLQQVMLHMKNLELEMEKNKINRQEEQREWETKTEAERIKREKDYQDSLTKILASSKTREDELLQIINNMKKAQATATTKKPSCLKSGTKIRMADGSEKPVELIAPGDIVVDMNFNPTSVIGASYEFLTDRKFYGFDNSSLFFTNSHIFVGPGEATDKHQLYCQSTSTLFNQNPLMEYLHVKDMESHVNVYHLNPKSTQIESKYVKLHEDPTLYPPQSKIYFIEVDSPTGTYIANGFVTRHEIPPVEHWPNTMPILFALMQDPSFEQVAKLPYSNELLLFFEHSSEQIAERVGHILEKYSRSSLPLPPAQGPLLTLESVDLNESIGKMFSSPTMVDVCMHFYASVGRVAAPYLEGSFLSLSPPEMASLQHVLLNTITDQLKEDMAQVDTIITIIQNTKN